MYRKEKESDKNKKNEKRVASAVREGRLVQLERGE